jgi:hypothetical protein
MRPGVRAFTASYLPLIAGLAAALLLLTWVDPAAAAETVESGHENLNAGGHLAERPRPRKLPAGGHEICTPPR